MEYRKIDKERLIEFDYFLCREEKSLITREKYLRDVKRFMAFCEDAPVTKERVVEWKQYLLHQGYAVCSVNSMLSSLNALLSYLGWQECRVKNVHLQRKIYCPEEKELTKGEYLRLLQAAGKREQLKLILQTICATGIRVSELQYFTMEAVKQGEVIVSCKNKTRTILVPGKLKKLLLGYARRKHITSGPIFLGRNGKALDRSCIWRQMKSLCAVAGVQASKVFPHNLRKLFARTFYSMEKDIAKLADILGHSNINTTRIYIMSTGTEHRRKMERLGLVL